MDIPSVLNTNDFMSMCPSMSSAVTVACNVQQDTDMQSATSSGMPCRAPASGLDPSTAPGPAVTSQTVENKSLATSATYGSGLFSVPRSFFQSEPVSALRQGSQQSIQFGQHTPFNSDELYESKSLEDIMVVADVPKAANSGQTRAFGQRTKSSGLLQMNLQRSVSDHTMLGGSFSNPLGTTSIAAAAANAAITAAVVARGGKNKRQTDSNATEENSDAGLAMLFGARNNRNVSTATSLSQAAPIPGPAMQVSQALQRDGFMELSQIVNALQDDQFDYSNCSNAGIVANNPPASSEYGTGFSMSGSNQIAGIDDNSLSFDMGSATLESSTEIDAYVPNSHHFDAQHGHESPDLRVHPPPTSGLFAVSPPEYRATMEQYADDGSSDTSDFDDVGASSSAKPVLRPSHTIDAQSQDIQSPRLKRMCHSRNLQGGIEPGSGAATESERSILKYDSGSGGMPLAAQIADTQLQTKPDDVPVTTEAAATVALETTDAAMSDSTVKPIAGFYNSVNDLPGNLVCYRKCYQYCCNVLCLLYLLCINLIQCRRTFSAWSSPSRCVFSCMLPSLNFESRLRTQRTSVSA
jgi:hypothetical protein